MRRRRVKKNGYRRGNPAIIFFLFIILCSGLLLTAEAKGTDYRDLRFDIKTYISSAMAVVGADDGEKTGLNNDADEKQEPETESEPSFENAVSSNPAQGDAIAKTEDETTESRKGLWQFLLCTALSDGSFDDSKIAKNETEVSEIPVVSSAVAEAEPVTANPVTSDVSGTVFIYHTHSTESYSPYSDGNYHITGEQGTVRNVADRMQEVLEAKGITVYHDRTLHDSPSYTHSYGRSLQTAQNYLAQHPDIKVMIDLHRDAVAVGGKKYSTIETAEGVASSFNIVVGKQNPNYQQLMNFASLVISKANELYPGLGGRIIERDYKFNQYLSDYYVLLEVGNNGNTIEETEMTGKLLGDVIEAVMREI